ncbi:HAAS signaling domain-containing protein [Bacillus sp. JJ1773]
MNKESYLRELQRKLRKLPDEEVNAALDYYSEYFDEAE